VSILSVATVNGEWMNDWFTPDADPVDFKSQFSRDGEVGDTDEAASRLAGLIEAINVDVVALVEAPSRPAELALFVDRYLTANGAPTYQFLLGDSGGSQKLALLFKPQAASFELIPSTDLPLLLEPWSADVDGDAVLDEYRFTRTPLACQAELAGVQLEVIVAHLKSNFINQGREQWQDPARRRDFIKAALRNRRRIATEAMRIRKHLEQRLDADRETAVVVLGDLNDGPGQDYFEEFYLAHNVTDILVGSPYRPERLFNHAQADVAEIDRYSAVFDDFVTEEPDKRLLLDHILLSPAMIGANGVLTKVPGSGRVEDDAWAAQVAGNGTRRDQRATDHRPATVLLTYQ
jgi:endonuclease/exonuclease/phosphatase family metal-dependent hydrolase